MKKLTTFLALCALAAGANHLSATTTRNVDGYELDSTKPGLKFPRTYDLDSFPGDVAVVGDVTATGDVTSGTARGVVFAVTGLTMTESGLGFIRQTVFTLDDVEVAVVDATTNGAHGGVQLLDFSAGLISFLGATSDLAVVAGVGGIGDSGAVICALGTAVVANSNETLTSTEANVIPSTAATLTGGAGACDGEMTTALLALVDGTGTAVNLFLNFAVDADDASADDTLTVNGTVTVTWAYHGDN